MLLFFAFCFLCKARWRLYDVSDLNFDGSKHYSLQGKAPIFRRNSNSSLKRKVNKNCCVLALELLCISSWVESLVLYILGAYVFYTWWKRPEAFKNLWISWMHWREKNYAFSKANILIFFKLFLSKKFWQAKVCFMWTFLISLSSPSSFLKWLL